jgi:hypothetical protein
MRALIIIFSTLFSVSTHLVHASSMLDEHRENPVFSASQKGTLEVPEINKIFMSFFNQLMSHVELSEQAEKDIQKNFNHEAFEAISNYGWEAEQKGNNDLAFSCMRFAAIGGIMAEQAKLAEYYLEKKDYKNAARWYLLSALNNNSDVLAMLHRIDKKRQIMPYVDGKNLPLASAILEEYLKSENIEG